MIFRYKKLKKVVSITMTKLFMSVKNRQDLDIAKQYDSS